VISNKRLIEKATILNFGNILKTESWTDVYSHHDINNALIPF
jgi:hypothetical protein